MYTFCLLFTRKKLIVAILTSTIIIMFTLFLFWMNSQNLFQISFKIIFKKYGIN